MSIFKSQVFQAGITRLQRTYTYTACSSWHRKKIEVSTSSFTPPRHVKREHSVIQLLSSYSYSQEAGANQSI